MVARKPFGLDAIIRICYAVAMIAQVIICAATPYENQEIIKNASNALHTAILGGSILLIGPRLGSRFVKPETLLILLLVTMCAVSVICSLGFSADMLIKVACFLEMPLSMLLAYHVGHDKGIRAMARAAAILTSAAFLVQYWADFDTRYQVYFLGINKNFSGNMLLYNALLCLTFAAAGSPGMRIGFLAAFAVNSWLIFHSRCRTAMLVWVIAIFFITILRSLTLQNWTKDLVLAAPAIVICCLLVFPWINDIEMFGGTGSLTSGRENLYKEYMDNIRAWWIFGDLGQYKLENAHNGALTICASLGLAGYVTWFATQKRLLTMVQPHSVATAAWKIAYISVLCCLLTACMEAMVYVQGQQIAVMLSLFVVVCRAEANKAKA